ncbi:MAG: bifunctional [glutamate--ammonia ligase]-adenylyl-L-tyrosine phosphorylase/[glutamate--ammonia-ligase] adenylyltransferase [Betaproteobacteria bacterium]
MRTAVDAAGRPMDLPAAIVYSHHAERMRAAHPRRFAEVVASIDSPWTCDDELSHALAQTADAASLDNALRQLREQVFLRTMLRDLTGRADLAEVCAATTRLADVAIASAVDAHTRWLVAAHGEPIGAESGDVQGLQVIAMGKLGGGELNVSSDVDLIFAFPEDGSTRGAKPLANQEFFDRLGRRVIAALDERTADGFVFRVDMRLRPYGDSGALTCSYATLEQYLIAQGRTWERYAWLKARPLTASRSDELMRLVTPFVYRKYLDYDAYEGLRDVHRQIREQGKSRDYAANIKLGPGGIRELEFIVQAQQLVRGGRDPGLRERGTLPALARLAARGVLPPATVSELRVAYVFLRDLEHRLQYRDDAQTQDLPTDSGDRRALASACGFEHAADFETALHVHRNGVTRHFDVLFGEATADAADPMVSLWLHPAADEERESALADAGYDRPEVVIEALARVRGSARYLQLPARSRQRFDALVPQLLRAAAASQDPVAVFLRLLSLLETVSGRSAYLALLVEHPPILPRITHLVAASAWAADYLARHPILLDELLDRDALFAEPEWDAWRRELADMLALHLGDAERQIDDLRHFQHAQTFRLLVQDVSGALSIERLADHLSALADVVLEATLACCWEHVRGDDDAAPRFAIVGYGKLGGKELGYASDLDIVFLYDDPRDIAAERYARLAQRINAWLTSATAAGRLYETDLRLRPDGVSGLLVSSVDAFRQYQRTQAWPWEHQALTRARFVAGDAAIGAAFDRERELILRLRRDPAALAADVIDMRAKMHAAHPNPTRLFDVKHDPGGMVDVEFSVQYLVLAHAHDHASLCRNAGNIALLGTASGLGLISDVIAQAAADAYREYRRVQHQIRLQGARVARTESGPQSSRRADVAALWQQVFGQPRAIGQP